MLNTNQNIIEKKEKLVKWYGWVFIFVICITPLVIVVLPKLMFNVGRINKILRESIIPNDSALSCKVIDVGWEKHIDGDLGCIEGNIEVESIDGSIVKCKFIKYVGPKHCQTYSVKYNDQILLTGSYKDDLFLIRSLENITNKYKYTTEPQVSVY
ncbi:hypothetical protein JCM14036_21110 [Desulfotomaculum defluvii]